MFLGFDRRADVVCLLEIDQTVDLVAFRESVEGASFVFVHTAFEIIGHADVEGARDAAHDVDEVGLGARCSSRRHPGFLVSLGMTQGSDTELEDTGFLASLRMTQRSTCLARHSAAFSPSTNCSPRT